jgi:hypothetical protein
MESLPESPAAEVPTLGPLAAGSPTRLTRTLIGVRAAVADHLGRAPTRAEPSRGHTVASPAVWRNCDRLALCAADRETSVHVGVSVLWSHWPAI